MDLFNKIGQFVQPRTQSTTPVHTGYPAAPKIGGGGQEPSFIERISTIGGNDYGGINFNADTLARLDALDQRERRPDVSGNCTFQILA